MKKVMCLWVVLMMGCVTTGGQRTSYAECYAICESVTESFCAKEVRRQRGCSEEKRAKELKICVETQCQRNEEG